MAQSNGTMTQTITADNTTSNETTSNPDPLASNPFLVNMARTFNVTSIPLAIFILICICIACIILIALIILCVQSAIRRKYRSRTQRKRMKPIYVDEIPGLATNSVESKYGSLEYSLEYNIDRKELKVGVIQANNLAKQPGIDFLDPYVIVTMARQESAEQFKQLGKQQKTRVIKQCTHPCWQEFFVYQISDAELRRAILIFEVFDYDSIGQDHSIGRLRLALQDIDQGEYAGKVMERTGWLTAGVVSSIGIGELCIGLGYYPKGERLDVLVMEGRQLMINNIIRPNKQREIYVVVKLKHNKQLLGKHETKPDKNTSDPYFNSRISFHLKEKFKPDAYVVCEVKHRGSFGHKRLLARTTIGEQSDQTTGVKQWEEMLKEPGKCHMKWHALSPNPEH